VGKMVWAGWLNLQFAYQYKIYFREVNTNNSLCLSSSPRIVKKKIILQMSRFEWQTPNCCPKILKIRFKIVQQMALSIVCFIVCLDEFQV
jgi:hypothetical protein